MIMGARHFWSGFVVNSDEVQCKSQSAVSKYTEEIPYSSRDTLTDKSFKRFTSCRNYLFIIDEDRIDINLTNICQRIP